MDSIEVSFYWALMFAMVVVGFAWHRYLCEDLRKYGWLRNRVNRLRIGALLFGAGVMINTVLWGLQQEYRASGLFEVSSFVRDLALDTRPASRGFMVFGALLMTMGFVDRMKEILIVVGATALVFALTVLWHMYH